MGLLDAFGFGDTGVGKYVSANRNTLGELASGLASGQNIGHGIGNTNFARGRKADDANAQRVAEEDERKRQIAQAAEQKNQTVAWLQKNYPQFADLPPAEGFKLATQLAGQQRAGPAKRNVIKGADGFQYFQDTGERVLPDVVAKEVAPNVVVNTGSDFKVPTGYMRDPQNTGQVVPIPGGPQDLNTPTASNKAETQKINSASTALDQSLTAYNNLVQTYGAQVIPGEGKDALLAARRDAQLQMKELFNLGVLNGPDLELLNEMMVDPTSAMTAIQSMVTAMAGGGDIKSRVAANVKQLRAQFGRIRDSRTPGGTQGGAVSFEEYF